MKARVLISKDGLVHKPDWKDKPVVHLGTVCGLSSLRQAFLGRKLSDIPKESLNKCNKCWEVDNEG